MSSMGVVKVICGANDDTLALVGCQVGTVRNSLVDAFNVPPQAIAFVNGKVVDPFYRLQADDTLEFCKKHGNKGTRRMFTKAEILREYTGYPADVMNDLFATLRHDDVNADGQPIWHEAVVDEWLDQRYCRERVDDGQDKVIPPSSVRIAGREVVDLTPLEWRLMEVLLSNPSRSVEISRAIEHGWGHDTDRKENALKQVIKRLNERLANQKCPCLVSQANGFVTITR